VVRFIDRKQLYKEVWNTPLTKLALKYGLATYKLKKLCDVFLIPLPKVGHWSKVAFGKKVETLPLPLYNKCRLKPKGPVLNKKTVPVLYATKKIEKRFSQNIIVKKNLTKPHLITVKTRDGLKRCETDEYGMKKPWGGGFDLRVSKVNERRALLIIDTLCKWFEKNNIKIHLPFEKNNTTEVIIDDQRIRIKIEEKSKLTGKTLTERWGGYEYYTREYTPTEQLALIIDNYCWNCSIRKVWRDGKTSKVEEKLDEFVAALFQHAEYEKARELRLEAERVEREKQHKLKKYHEACTKLEQEMLNELIQQSKNAMYSRELYKYINEVKQRAKLEYKNTQYPKRLINWITWAENYARELDPLSKGLPTYQKATEIINLED
jgi:hypothetical protein